MSDMTAKPAISRRFQLVLLVMIVVIAVGFSSLVEQVYRLETQRLADHYSAVAVRDASQLRARIEGELNTALYLPLGLSAYIHAHGDDLDSTRVEAALAQVVRQGQHVRNIGLAPDNVIRYLYPLAGNEAALGLSYREQQDQWPDVELAMTRREAVMAGPVPLVQGGKGLINRTPIFLQDGQYWGILSMVLDVDSLFSAVGLEQMDEQLHALRRRTHGVDDWLPVFGNNDLFDSPPASGVIIQNIRVPGADWQLAWTVPGREDYASTESLGLLLRWPGHLLALTVLGFGLLLLIERRRTEHLVNHDPLTGLPNRRLLMTQLAVAIDRHRQQRKGFALIYLDLDGFKPVNDRLGHDAGDRLLVEVAKRLQRGLPSGAFAVRVGGDEFVILLPDETEKRSIDDVAGELLQRIRSPIELGIEEVTIGASAGVAICPFDGENADRLLRVADQQMYARKAERRLSEMRPALY